MTNKASPTKKRFERVPHTSELQLKIFGSGPEELFQNAVFALAQSVKQELPAEFTSIKPVEVEAPDQELLLADFLQEIVVLMDIYNEVYPKVEFEELGSDHLKATLYGMPIIQFDEEVKGVTYHSLKIEKKGRKYEAEVVLDV
jgi:SHS2 domain-containing protein